MSKIIIMIIIIIRIYYIKKDFVFYYFGLVIFRVKRKKDSFFLFLNRCNNYRDLSTTCITAAITHTHSHTLLDKNTLSHLLRKQKRTNHWKPVLEAEPGNYPASAVKGGFCWF